MDPSVLAKGKSRLWTSRWALSKSIRKQVTKWREFGGYCLKVSERDEQRGPRVLEAQA